VAQSNIYAQKENGDLRLIAEIEGLSDPAMAVDALLDEMPRLKQREFIVIDLDNVMLVEAGDEIVQPRRQIVVSNGGNISGAAVAAPEEDETEPEEEPEAEAPPKPAPKRRQSGRSRAKPASNGKTTARRGSGSRRRGGGSAFKKNAASAD
jgi:hypothetical protein